MAMTVTRCAWRRIELHGELAGDKYVALCCVFWTDRVTGSAWLGRDVLQHRGVGSMQHVAAWDAHGRAALAAFIAAWQSFNAWGPLDDDTNIDGPGCMGQRQVVTAGSCI